MQEDQEPKLTFKFDNDNPVSLIDLTTSFSGISGQFKRYLKVNRYPFEDDGLKLYIKDISSGSIEADLVVLGAFAAPALLFLNQFNTIVSFSKNLKELFGYFLGRNDKPENLQIPDCKNCSKIVSPIASDQNGQLNINATNGSSVEVNINLNYEQANAVQNASRREMERLGAPKQEFQPKVILYWYQARDEKGSTTGDRAVIEQISKKPLKVIFDDDGIKDAMIHSQNNPFLVAFIVDVHVETINGKPAAYRILNLHEVFENPLEED